jgi:glutaredoxin
MPGKTPRVTLYSTSRCANCRRLKQWLTRHKLRFQEFDIERNQRAFREFQRLGSRGVPVLLVDRQRVDGFDPKRLEKIFGPYL